MCVFWVIFIFFLHLLPILTLFIYPFPFLFDFWQFLFTFYSFKSLSIMLRCSPFFSSWAFNSKTVLIPSWTLFYCFWFFFFFFTFLIWIFLPNHLSFKTIFSSWWKTGLQCSWEIDLCLTQAVPDQYWCLKGSFLLRAWDRVFSMCYWILNETFQSAPAHPLPFLW